MSVHEEPVDEEPVDEGPVHEETAHGQPGRSTPTWRRAPGWVHRAVDDEILLVGPGGESKSIGGMATAVWLVLDRPSSAAEIQDLIARRWPDRPVDPATAVETIEVLHREGLIEPA